MEGNYFPGVGSGRGLRTVCRICRPHLSVQERPEAGLLLLHAWETGPLYEAAWVETPVAVNKLLNLGISVSSSQLNSFKLN